MRSKHCLLYLPTISNLFSTSSTQRQAKALCISKFGSFLLFATPRLMKVPYLFPPYIFCSYKRLVQFFTEMLLSDNYVLQRQSLKLLSEFLLDRDNFKIMMKFISDKGNLKLIMNMLRQPQSNIQFEAFHVFKVFVANPIKPPEISEILLANKAKLVAFLRGFQNDKDDEQFKEEKEILIYTLECL